MSSSLEKLVVVSVPPWRGIHRAAVSRGKATPYGAALAPLAALCGLPKNSVAIFGRKALVEPIGIEPMTPCLQSRCSPS